MNSRPKILVVDDNAVNIAILEELLSDDYSVSQAMSGEEALDLAQEILPDLILLDIMMPGMDGYETCLRIRANTDLRHTKVIMVSARAMPEERLEGYGVGADDYVTKPFNESELLAKVRVFLRLKSIEEVDHLKSNVLSLLSHETRTPLNGIITPAEILADEDELNADQRMEYGELIRSNAYLLLDFFEKVMKLSALRSGKHLMSRHPKDIDSIVSTAVEKSRGFAQETQVKLVTKLAADTRVALDDLELQEVLISVLHNAIRFSWAAQTITVETESEDSHVSIRIQDQGLGIPANFLPYIKTEFATIQLDNHSEGHGLSLALSNEIILLHDGKLTIESEEGKGTCVQIELPVYQPPKKPVEPQCATAA